MASFVNLVETIAIVSTGTYIHLKSISVIDLNFTKLPSIQPNGASTLFVFSVLCVFARLRSYWWPKSLKKPSKLFTFPIDVCLSLYMTDFLVRQLWIPLVRVLNAFCSFLGEYILVGNQELLTKHASWIVKWIHSDGFYWGRLFLAMCAFLFMIQVTGVFELLIPEFPKNDYQTQENIRALADEVLRNDFDPFMESIEDEGNNKKSNSRKKNGRKSPRKSPRKVKSPRKRIVLNTLALITNVKKVSNKTSVDF